MPRWLPPVAFRFEVDFNGADLSPTAADLQFQEVSGLSAELEVVTLAEGGENRFVHRLPGRVKHGTLTLKRGHVPDSSLLTWFEEAAAGVGVKTADVTIKLTDGEGKPVQQWHVVRAWPVKWSVSALDASKNGYVVDTVELAFQRIKRTRS